MRKPHRKHDRQFHDRYHAIYSDIERLPKITEEGTPYRHRIAMVAIDDRVFYLHATKGWRSESV